MVRWPQKRGGASGRLLWGTKHQDKDFIMHASIVDGLRSLAPFEGQAPWHNGARSSTFGSGSFLDSTAGALRSIVSSPTPLGAFSRQCVSASSHLGPPPKTVLPLPLDAVERETRKKITSYTDFGDIAIVDQYTNVVLASVCALTFTMLALGVRGSRRGNNGPAGR